MGSHGRCSETGFLEFHHVEPYAAGGVATSRNIELRCKQHNSYEAELFFGLREPPMVRESRAVFRSSYNSGRTEDLRRNGNESQHSMQPVTPADAPSPGYRPVLQQ